MSRHRRPTILALAVSVLVFAGHYALWAGGAKEDPLASARKLLDEGKLSEALLQNIDAFLANKDQQDAVLKLLEATVAKNQEFNKVLDRFAKTDFTTDQGIAAGKEILAELRAIDKAPNSETATSLALMESQLVYQETNRQYITLLDEVLPTVQSGDYYESVTRYLTAFDTLGRRTFDEANYASLLKGTAFATLKEDTLRDVAEVKTAAQEAMARKSTLEAALADVQSAASRGDAAALAEAAPRLVSELDYLDTRRDTITAAAVRIKGRHAALLASDQRIFENFLWFSYHAITGERSPTPGTATPPTQAREGIINALELRWETAETAAADAVQAKAAELVAAAKASFRDGSYEAAEPVFASAYGFLTDANRLLRAWGTQFRVGVGLKPTSKGSGLIGAYAPRMVLNQEQAKETVYYRDLAVPFAYLRTTKSLDATVGVAGLGTLQKARNELDARRTTTRDIRSRWSDQVDRYRTLVGSTGGSTEAAKSANETLAVMDDAIARFDREDTRIAEIQAGIEYAQLQRRYDALYADMKAGEAQIAGITVVLTAKNEAGQEVQATRVERYPVKAQGMLAEARLGLGTLKTDISITAARWQGVLKPPLPSVPIQGPKGYLAQGESIAGLIQHDVGEIDVQARIAKQNEDDARKLAQEGDDAFKKAQADLKREDFAAANDSIARATTAWDASLGLSEVAELRNRRNVDFLAFTKEVERVQQERAYRRSREFLAAGKRLYSQGDYRGANAQYQQAKDEWFLGYTDSDPEIDRALRDVNIALQSERQRIITPDNPLYDIVSQLYNTALAAYQDGAKLMKQGKDATGSLAAAKATIADMRQLVPQYQDMRVLELLIAQLEDKEQFSSKFSAFLKEASDKIAGNDAATRDARNLLLVLQQVDPKYLGLDAALKRAAAALNPAATQPVAQNVNRSKQLYQLAYADFQKRDANLLDAVLKNLNDALEAWDGNEPARSLKQQVLAQQGSGKTVALNSDLETKYREALRLYQSKEYFRAKTAMDDLMKDVSARKYQPAIELQRRIALETG